MLAPLVNALYIAQNAETSKLKSDFSLFTIADGIVQVKFLLFLPLLISSNTNCIVSLQCILKDHLFGGNKFEHIVGTFTLSVVCYFICLTHIDILNLSRSQIGEEDEAHINLSDKPYSVDHLPVPEQFVSLIDTAMREIKIHATQIDAFAYKHLTVFIDPIDGTKEFASGVGEQCTILVGFADRTKKPVAGVIYRKRKISITFVLDDRSCIFNILCCFISQGLYRLPQLGPLALFASLMQKRDC